MRTGYEQIIPLRTSDLYAATAQQKGKITNVTKRSVEVTYEDGTIHSVALGTQHATAAGVTYPHEVSTPLKEGDAVNPEDVIAYNRQFFAEDPFNPGKVAMRAGVLVKTAIMDNVETLEDGSVISEEVAEKLRTKTTEIKTLQIRFDQSVRDLVSVGDHVDIDSILCVIEDPETAENPLFDDVAMDTLKRLSSSTPTAKVSGHVSRVDVYYHGDFEDLSPNLQTLASRFDKERKRQAKALGKKGFTGEVDTNFRVNGAALDPDTLAIQVYIDHDVGMGKGDKLVISHQMKSVVSRVMTGRNETERGEPLGAFFGNVSIENRKVLSPKLMGTTITLQKALSKHVAGVYRGTNQRLRGDDES